jgi:hypothetical protein
MELVSFICGKNEKIIMFLVFRCIGLQSFTVIDMSRNSMQQQVESYILFSFCVISPWPA